MADDKLKTGPESPVLDHPDGGPVGDAQAVTKIPAPEEVEGPAAGTGPAPQPEQSVIPGMGKDAPAQPVPQVEAEKTGKSLNQDKKVEPEEKTAKRRGRPPKEQDHPQGGKAEKGPEPRKGRPAKADKAALGKSPAPGVLDKVVCTPSSRQRNNLHFTHENPSCIPYGAGCYAASRRSWTSIGVRTPRPRWRRWKL